jgi:hypothetical protein
MPVSVAEYLGIRTDTSLLVQPLENLASKPTVPCPFRNAHCLKAKKGQQPVCSVRDSSGELWIVCEHRLCATTPKAGPVNEHQKNILRLIGRAIYSQSLTDEEILIKREEQIPITATSDYKADFIMWRLNPRSVSPIAGDKAAIVEIQGGGETASTEKLTAHLKEWANLPHPTNTYLTKGTNATPLVTNAWRRQQEQFLVKGSVAMLTGAKIAFCVGSMLYDYLIQRLTTVNLQDLKGDNWSLALLAFIEDRNVAPPACAPNSIQFKIDPERTLYTNYFSFVQALTNQGAPQPRVFTGDYQDLNGTTVSI